MTPGPPMTPPKKGDRRMEPGVVLVRPPIALLFHISIARAVGGLIPAELQFFHHHELVRGNDAPVAVIEAGKNEHEIPGGEVPTVGPALQCQVARVPAGQVARIPIRVGVGRFVDAGRGWLAIDVVQADRLEDVLLNERDVRVGERRRIRGVARDLFVDDGEQDAKYREIVVTVRRRLRRNDWQRELSLERAIRLRDVGAVCGDAAGIREQLLKGDLLNRSGHCPVARQIGTYLRA